MLAPLPHERGSSVWSNLSPKGEVETSFFVLVSWKGVCICQCEGIWGSLGSLVEEDWDKPKQEMWIAGLTQRQRVKCIWYKRSSLFPRLPVPGSLYFVQGLYIQGTPHSSRLTTKIVYKASAFSLTLLLFLRHSSNSLCLFYQYKSAGLVSTVEIKPRI